MYDAEVGSSGGRCESGPWIDVGEDRVETSRRASSVAEVAMYRGSNMISKRTEAEIPLKEVHIENNNNEKHNMGKHENIGTQIRDGQQEDGRFHDRCFFFSIDVSESGLYLKRLVTRQSSCIGWQ